MPNPMSTASHRPAQTRTFRLLGPDVGAHRGHGKAGAVQPVSACGGDGDLETIEESDGAAAKPRLVGLGPDTTRMPSSLRLRADPVSDLDHGLGVRRGRFQGCTRAVREEERTSGIDLAEGLSIVAEVGIASPPCTPGHSQRRT